jgi:rhodanese-related sulfurtransferase
MTAPTPAPDGSDEIPRISAAEAHALVEAGRGVLVDTRDRRLYDNAHPSGAISLPLAEIETTQSQIPASSVPPDRVLILYCA